MTVTTSVIIPVYNDPEGLRTTVESVLDQTVDDYEVIIADNGSTDLTRKLAKAYATQDRVVHVVEDSIQSSYAARNAGIRASQGDILCFIDADMWVDSTWLEQVQNRIKEGSVRYLGCNVVVVVEDNTVFSNHQKEKEFPIKNHIEENNFCETCCLVIRRDVIDDVGLFDSRVISGGDVEFGLRVHRAGYDQVYADDIVMYHPARSTLSSIIKKYYRIARGRVQRTRYYPDQFQLDRHPLNPLNFLPVKPQAVYGSSDRRIKDFLITYVISYLKKLVDSVGEAKEWYYPTQVRKRDREL